MKDTLLPLKGCINILSLSTIRLHESKYEVYHLVKNMISLAAWRKCGNVNDKFVILRFEVQNIAMLFFMLLFVSAQSCPTLAFKLIY